MHISILLLAALATKTSASDIVWEPLCEPGCGGAIVSLAVSPHNPRHLVSGGDMLGTAVSFDAGETWTPGMGLPAYEMATPTFHPQRTNELWIGSCMGPFLSRDGGKTWQWRRKGMPKASRYHYTAMIEKVLVDPVDPNRLLAFGGSSRRWGTCEAMGAIWVSENGGDDWRRVGTISSDGFTTNAVKGANIVKAWWSAEKRPWVNIFAESAGWFSSLDGGLTWRRRKVSGLPASLGSVTTHPADPGIVWAVVAPAKNEGDEPRTPGAIWRSSDGGRTFHPCDAGIVKTADGNPNLVSHFSEIEASPVRLGRLYVSDFSWKSHAIWVSDDAGTTWRKGCSKKNLETACFAGPGCRIAASPTEPDVAYAYNSEYVLKTTDGGRTWHDATAVRPMASKLGNWRGRGWNGWCSRNVAFNPYRRGQSVVQAMDAGRGWISDDGLKSWHYAHGGVDPWCGGNGAAFSRDGSIYLTTGQNGHNNGIVFSHDGGCSWSASSGPKHGLPERGEGSYGGVWVDPDDGRRAFALFDGKRYVTEDGGISWAGEKTEKSGAFAADPTTPGRFFVKSADGVFETHDWKSFRLMGLPGASEGKIACDALGRVLVCRGRTGDSKTRGLWRCDPSGGEWVRLHDDPLACAVASDPKDPTRLVLTTSDNPYHDFAGANGVYVSSDDGRTWQSANEGLHVRRLTCVAFDPFDGETLVAGTLGGGFVKATWPRSEVETCVHGGSNGTAFDILDFGAKGDGVTKDTAAIQRAIDAANNAGGGEVLLPKGIYLCGSVFLKSGVDFHLAEGAVLKGSPDPADYNALDIAPQNWGRLGVGDNISGGHLVLCIEQENVTLRGPGKIDGNVGAFLRMPDGSHPPTKLNIPWRPAQMVWFVESRNVAIRDIEIADAPYWSCFIYGCEDVSVERANIHTVREPHTYNGDGLDIDSSRRVRVTDCKISAADDAITLRAAGQGRLKNDGPCADVTVSNCTFSSDCNAIRLGVGNGEIRDCSFRDIKIVNSRCAVNAVGAWSRPEHGVDISRISFENMEIDAKIFCKFYYRFATHSVFDGISFRRIRGKVRGSSIFDDTQERPFKNLRFKDVLLDGETSPRIVVVPPGPST